MRVRVYRGGVKSKGNGTSYRDSTVCHCVECCNFLNWRLPCERDKLRAKKCYPDYIENSPRFCLTIYIF